MNSVIVKLWREESWIIAQCLHPDIASQGATEDEALDNMREALRLHQLEPQRCTVETGVESALAAALDCPADAVEVKLQP